MIKPEGVANVLQSKLHAIEASYEPIGERGEKLFAYALEFDEYRTFALLKEQTRAARRIVEVDLCIDRVEPAIHMEGNRIEARIRVVINETTNRHELENRSLGDFN